MKTKPVQIGILVAAVVSVGVSTWWMMSRNSGPDLPRRVTMVDVSTGQLYEVSTSRRAVTEPAQHPETGKFSLVRVQKDESGKWVVSERSIDLLESMQNDLGVDPKSVNPETGEVLSPSQGVRSLTP